MEAGSARPLLLMSTGIANAKDSSPTSQSLKKTLTATVSPISHLPSSTNMEGNATNASKVAFVTRKGVFIASLI